jgi:hypothetical protein
MKFSELPEKVQFKFWNEIGRDYSVMVCNNRIKPVRSEQDMNFLILGGFETVTDIPERDYTTGKYSIIEQFGTQYVQNNFTVCYPAMERSRLVYLICNFWYEITQNGHIPTLGDTVQGVFIHKDLELSTWLKPVNDGNFWMFNIGRILAWRENYYNSLRCPEVDYTVEGATDHINNMITNLIP